MTTEFSMVIRTKDLVGLGRCFKETTFQSDGSNNEDSLMAKCNHSDHRDGGAMLHDSNDLDLAEDIPIAAHSSSQPVLIN